MSKKLAITPDEFGGIVADVTVATVEANGLALRVLGAALGDFTPVSSADLGALFTAAESLIALGKAIILRGAVEEQHKAAQV